MALLPVAAVVLFLLCRDATGDGSVTPGVSATASFQLSSESASCRAPIPTATCSAAARALSVGPRRPGPRTSPRGRIAFRRQRPPPTPETEPVHGSEVFLQKTSISVTGIGWEKLKVTFSLSAFTMKTTLVVAALQRSPSHVPELAPPTKSTSGWLGEVVP